MVLNHKFPIHTENKGTMIHPFYYRPKKKKKWILDLLIKPVKLLRGNISICDCKYGKHFLYRQLNHKE